MVSKYEKRFLKVVSILQWHYLQLLVSSTQLHDLRIWKADSWVVSFMLQHHFHLCNVDFMDVGVGSMVFYFSSPYRYIYFSSPYRYIFYILFLLCPGWFHHYRCHGGLRGFVPSPGHNNISLHFLHFLSNLILFHILHWYYFGFLGNGGTSYSFALMGLFYPVIAYYINSSYELHSYQCTSLHTLSYLATSIEASPVSLALNKLLDLCFFPIPSVRDLLGFYKADVRCYWVFFFSLFLCYISSYRFSYVNLVPFSCVMDSFYLWASNIWSGPILFWVAVHADAVKFCYNFSNPSTAPLSFFNPKKQEKKKKEKFVGKGEEIKVENYSQLRVCREEENNGNEQEKTDPPPI